MDKSDNNLGADPSAPEADKPNATKMESFASSKFVSGSSSPTPSAGGGKLFSPVGNSAEPSWDQSGKSDALVRPGVPMPHVMRMGATMILHSHLAINMFRGRKGDAKRREPQIIGLARCASQLALVWSAAEKDDPYAEQCLVDIEFKYNEVKALFEQRKDSLNSILTGLEGLSVGIQTSTKPSELSLNFYCPWAYKLTGLLIEYDNIVRLSLTARHIGLMGDSEWDAVVGDSGRVLRHVFALASRWINTGVTREDVRKGTRVAKRAFGMYAEVKENRLELSEGVIAGARAKLAPANKLLDKFLNKQNVA